MNMPQYTTTETKTNHSVRASQRMALFCDVYRRHLNLMRTDPKHEADKAVAAFDAQFPEETK